MTACGSYGISGYKGTKGGYDAILIPGARSKSSAIKVGAECQAGGSKGLVTAAAGMATATVCCKYLDKIHMFPYIPWQCILGQA